MATGLTCIATIGSKELERRKSKPITYFKIEKPHKITSILHEELEFEAEIEEFKSLIH